MSRPRVLFYVQNLLGIGHVTRARRIAMAMEARGLEVHVVTGGVPVPGLDFPVSKVTELPAVKSGPGGFADLRDENGAVIDEVFRARRTERLLDAFTSSRPDLLLIESYPFGRRGMRFELRPLLELVRSARSKPIVATSIRDILQENQKPEKARWIVEELRRHFDRVLVHGDAEVVPLAATFPYADEIADMTAYSGLVGAGAAEIGSPADGAAAHPVHDVIVSVGGGAVGRDVLEIAIRAKPATPLADARWLAVAGTNLPPGDLDRIKALAGRHAVTLERFVPDLARRFMSARLSISQAGYNTVAEIMRAGCRSVLVPFAAGGETEQTRRAELMAAAGRAVWVAEAGLTVEIMARAVAAADGLAAPPPAPQLDGAARTAELIFDWIGERRAQRAR